MYQEMECSYIFYQGHLPLVTESHTRLSIHSTTFYKSPNIDHNHDSIILLYHFHLVRDHKYQIIFFIHIIKSFTKKDKNINDK